jgi:hypothetical protein
MTDCITVTTTGIYPKGDVDFIADFYGVGQPSNIDGVEFIPTTEDKIKAIVKIVEIEIAKVLSAPMKKYYAEQAEVQKAEILAGVDERVAQSLTSTIEGLDE